MFVEQIERRVEKAIHVTGADVTRVVHEHVDAAHAFEHRCGRGTERRPIEEIARHDEHASRPAARIAAAVVSRLPGNGDVSERVTVDECSRASPSFTVRARIATS